MDALVECPVCNGQKQILNGCIYRYITVINDRVKLEKHLRCPFCYSKGTVSKEASVAFFLLIDGAPHGAWMSYQDVTEFRLRLRRPQGTA